MSPREPAENQRIKDERREQLLTAARAIFARKGLAATKIADIAAAAGMSHGLVYHYFPSKEAVYAAIVERALEGAARVTAAALERPGSPWDRLRWVCDQMLAGVRDAPEYALLTIQALVSETVPEELQAAVQRHGSQPFPNLLALVRQGQEAGQVVAGNPEELTLTYLATIQGLAISGLAGEEGRRHFPSVDTVLRLLKAEQSAETRRCEAWRDA